MKSVLAIVIILLIMSIQIVYAQTPRDVVLNACTDTYKQMGMDSSIAMDQCNIDFDYMLKTCINTYKAFNAMDQTNATNQCNMDLEQVADAIQSGEPLPGRPLPNQSDPSPSTGPPPS